MAYASVPTLDMGRFGDASMSQIDPATLGSIAYQDLNFAADPAIGVNPTFYFEFGNKKVDGSTWGSPTSSLTSLNSSHVVTTTGADAPIFSDGAMVVGKQGYNITGVFAGPSESLLQTVIVGFQYGNDAFMTVCGTKGSLLSSGGAGIQYSSTGGMVFRNLPGTGLSPVVPSPVFKKGGFLTGAYARAATKFYAQVSIGQQQEQYVPSPVLRSGTSFNLGAKIYTSGSYQNTTPTISHLAVFVDVALSKNAIDAAINRMFWRQLARARLLVL